MSLDTAYQKFIHTSKYARWIPEKKRRENWEETVDRYVDYMCDEECKGKVDKDTKEKIREYIYNLKVMPSMRALLTAGPALRRCHVGAYNCAFRSVDSVAAFDEIMYCLMSGAGVGYSVEERHIGKLPIVPDDFYMSDTVVQVADSRIGWCKALKEVMGLLYSGAIPKWDVSKVRPAGARLKTFGGRASGPEPLVSLFKFLIEKFKSAKGRRLRDIEVHDIICKIGEIVVMGSVRRSALISLSDLGSYEMQNAKSGSWWENHPYRSMANNSAVYYETPTPGEYLKEWKAIYDSKSGERGIFNMESAKMLSERFGRRDPELVEGTNPCSEIILRNKQFCNLTEVIIREDDNLETMLEKIEIATILGTIQSKLTNFKYLSKGWANNCNEERLLGVSLTGICDNLFFAGKKDKEELADVLSKLREHAVAVNEKWANKIGITPSAAITCVKPSGTVSQLVNCASGIHPRYSKYYVRTVRSDKKDPLSDFMVDCGVYHESDLMRPNHTYVFGFPIAGPESSVYRDDMSAIEQLELWMIYQKNWCEHKPSVTIYIKEEEWMDVGAWIYKNFNWVSGIAFLPHTDHTYQQAPYQEIEKEEYDKMKEHTPEIDFTEFKEDDDNTTSSQEMACVGNVCEIVDLSTRDG